MGKQRNITLIYFINFINMQDSQLMKCRKFKCLGIQPNMYITMFLILLSDFVFIYQFIILRTGDKPYLISIIILKIIASLLQFAALCMTFSTNPGKVPQHWMLFYSIIPQQKRRYCLFCKQFKPLRTHHCSLCQKCVLNMDHHCPWVSNCVGLNNRKFFLLFLTFIIVDHIFCLGFGLPLQILQFVNISKGTEVVTAHTVIRLLSILLCLLIIVPVVMFTGLHMQMAFNNQTTVQDMKKNMKSQSLKEVQQYQYNIGCYDNFTQVCGINSLCWCCPLNPQLEVDGVQWPSLTRNGDIKMVK